MKSETVEMFSKVIEKLNINYLIEKNKSKNTLSCIEVVRSVNYTLPIYHYKVLLRFLRNAMTSF